MRHVDDGRLHAYLDGQLEQVEPGGVDAVERHLAGCDACRARLEHARRVRGEADSILAGMLPARLGDAAPEPAFRAAAAPRAVRRPRPWIPAAWAASILLAVSVGWLARRPGPQQEASRMPAAGSSPAPAAATAPAATAAAAEPQLASAAEAAESAAAGPPRVAAAPARARVRAYDDVERTGGTVAAGAEERVAMAMPPPPPLAPPAMAPPPSPVSAPAADYAVAEVAAADRSFAAPDSLVLKGQVTDRTGQGVAAAQVRAPGVGASTVTRADGSYALSIPTSRLQGRDTVSVRVARVGMEAQTRTLALGRADTLDFALRPSAIALESVISKADAERSKPGAGAPAAAASTAQAPARRERPRAGEWVAVERREAEALLGQRLLTLPGRPVVGLEMGEVQGQSVVRVRQALEDGKVLSILLQRDSGAPASAAVELERVRQGGVTMRQGSLIILLSGPFTPESLGSYGRRLRP